MALRKIETWFPGLRLARTYQLEWLRSDLVAGLSVAAVALAHRHRLRAACRVTTRGWYLLGDSPSSRLCFVRLVTTVDRQSRRCRLRDCCRDIGTARGR